MISPLNGLDAEFWTYSLVALLIAHMIADFAVRGEVLRRCGKAPSQRVVHHVVIFALLALALMMGNPLARNHVWYVSAVIVANAIVHLLVDKLFAIGPMWRDEAGPIQRRLFVLQQCIKLLSLLIAASIWTISFSPSYSLWQFFPHNWQSFSILGYVFGYLFALYAGDIIVSLVLTKLSWSPRGDDDGVPGAGRIIGIFEALLVVTFVISYQYSAIGFVLTAKSVARFEWLKEQKKAEYFLIGTLTNIAVAIAGGLAALWLTGQRVFPN